MATPWAATVILDCDSTLSAIEGVDEVAGPHKAESERLTQLAMQGQIPLEEVYGRRLDLIRPSRTAIEQLGELYIARLLPGAREAVAELHRHGVVVQLLSGGFAQAVEAVGKAIAVPAERVAAVRLIFDPAGGYRDFDRASPMTRSGGKREWIIANDARLPRRRIMVGDGVTDLETRPVVDCFAAFTGVVRREAVVTAADAILDRLEQAVALALNGPPR
ncbi:MAG TPA: HAD-IB family phosphatase [Gemmatimonadales bacterium]|nr:HAD-IB family phosphatase [Gemmatimonadales bacterium]